MAYLPPHPHTVAPSPVISEVAEARNPQGDDCDQQRCLREGPLDGQHTRGEQGHDDQHGAQATEEGRPDGVGEGSGGGCQQAQTDAVVTSVVRSKCARQPRKAGLGMQGGRA